MEVFAREGYAGTNVQEIADAAGVGKGTVYRCFPTKQALFLSTVDWGMAKLSTELAALRQSSGDKLVLLEMAVRAYLAFFERHPQLVELFMIERSMFKDRGRPAYFVHQEAGVESWKPLILELMRLKRIRRMPVERVIKVLNNVLYGTLFTNYFDNRHNLSDEAAEIMDVFFEGIEQKHD